MNEVYQRDNIQIENILNKYVGPFIILFVCGEIQKKELYMNIKMNTIHLISAHILKCIYYFMVLNGKKKNKFGVILL